MSKRPPAPVALLLTLAVGGLTVVALTPLSWRYWCSSGDSPHRTWWPGCWPWAGCWPGGGAPGGSGACGQRRQQCLCPVRQELVCATGGDQEQLTGSRRPPRPAHCRAQTGQLRERMAAQRASACARAARAAARTRTGPPASRDECRRTLAQRALAFGRDHRPWPWPLALPWPARAAWCAGCGPAAVDAVAGGRR